MTKIEWTEKTWNPIHGCTKVSEACQNCYAEVMARRLQGNHIKSYENGFKVSRNIDAMKEPYEWKKPSMVFVCSMGDLFHEDVPDAGTPRSSSNNGAHMEPTASSAVKKRTAAYSTARR